MGTATSSGSLKLITALAVVLLLDVILALLAVLKAPYPLRVDRGAPTAYLTIYIHVPLAWASYLFFFIAFLGGLLYITRGDARYDNLTKASAFLGEIYGIGTILTGMAWASESWGAAWNWDPRETGVLLLLLAYLGYFALRQSILDSDRRRQVASVYAVAAFATVPLSFVASYAVESLHPQASQASAFFSQPQVLKYFISRVAVATVTALLLLWVILKPRGSIALRLVGATATIIGLLGAVYLTLPYITGDPVQVLNATLDSEGRILTIVTSSGVIELETPTASPVWPPTYNGTPSVIGNLVLIEGGSVKLVTHWCVALALAVYSTTVGVLVLLADKIGGALRRV